METVIKSSICVGFALLLTSSGAPAKETGGMTYSGSADTCSVTAKFGDTVKWKFYANGPIHNKPVIVQNRVCFGSDDGFVYCVDAGSGKLIWKIRAVLSNRKVIHYGRLISMWPIRGIVAHEGRIYFAAGQWPSEGVYIYCVDVATGKTVWVQDRGVGFWVPGVRNDGYVYRGLPIAKYGDDMRIEGDQLVLDTTRYSKLGEWTGKLKSDPAGRDARLRLDNGNIAVFSHGTRETRRGVYDRRQGIVGGGLPRKGRTPPHSSQLGLPVDTAAHCRVYQLTQGRAAAQSPLHGKESPVTSEAGTLSSSAAEILEPSNATEGYVVVLGIGNGKLVKELADMSSEKLRIIAVDPDPAKIANLRGELVASGKYDSLKMMLMVGDPMTFELPEYMASVITSQDLKAAGVDQGIDFAKTLYRSVRPYGGAITIPLAVSQYGQFGKWAEDGTLPCAEVKRSGQLTTIVNTGPISGAANPTPATYKRRALRKCGDTAIRAPIGVLWYGHELPTMHKMCPNMPNFVDGIGSHLEEQYMGDEGRAEEKGPLRKYDCYTGRPLDDAGVAAITQRLEAVNPAPDNKPTELVARNPLTWEESFEEVNLGLSRKNDKGAIRKDVIGGQVIQTGGSCVGWSDFGYTKTGSNGCLGFFCKTSDSGTVWIPGIRAACFRNSIIPGCGLLNAAGYAGGCSCPYPLEYSAGFVSRPESQEQWCGWRQNESSKAIRRVGVNFGAPGQRRERDGTLWIDYPQIGFPGPKLDIKTDPPLAELEPYYRHSLWIRGGKGWPWVSASGVVGMKSLTISGLAKGATYTVRLYFAEPDELGKKGSRVFDVNVQGKTVLADFDVVAEAGGALRSAVKAFPAITPKDGSIAIDLAPKSGGPQIISGVEIIDTTLEPKAIPVLPENRLLHLITE